VGRRSLEWSSAACGSYDLKLNTIGTKTEGPRLAYKINEASALLGVSVITIRRAIDRGLIKPSRAFRHVLISADELQRFLDTTTAGYRKEGA
jgi:excisionase family DNA binding protein